MPRCGVCFRHCEIQEGGRGFCGARTCVNGDVCAQNYGRITGFALDPIEKKPLRRFYPGSRILSVGSYGCNLRCPFCQNHEISWSSEAMALAENAKEISPEELVAAALRTRNRGNIGIAFTYNEPLTGWEFVRDTAKLSHEAGEDIHHPRGADLTRGTDHADCSRRKRFRKGNAGNFRMDFCTDRRERTGDRAGNSASCFPVFPKVSYDGQAGNGREPDLSPGGYSPGKAEICLYRKLLSSRRGFVAGSWCGCFICTRCV